MKKNILILISTILFSCSHNTGSQKGIMQFSKNEYDYGIIPLKKKVEYSFEFTNSGENVLLIYNVKTSCGCTVPEWSKKPIKPKETGKITIKYNSEFPGMFHKEIMVYYNGVDSPVVLQIKGHAEYPKEKIQ